jgi:galactose mutarotase-like enzyme
MIEIASGQLCATINPLGAELSSLRDARGREWMTDADPAFWAGRAPLLFPIVGRLWEDKYRLDGRDYAMRQHGFARREEFALVERSAARALFRLTDNDATRAAYPFAFTLDAEFVAEGTTLGIAITVTNRSDGPMPASFGFHPAFAWPLPNSGARKDHRIVFARDEPEELVALADGGCTAPEPRTSPLDGRVLRLNDALFERDALIWAPAHSRSVRYACGDGPALRVDFPDSDRLGIWTKPGAKFVCIEPWNGIADPHGFTGEIWDKPGIHVYAPGESARFRMDLTLEA